MDITTFLAVLLAAALHAAWNAVVKGSGDALAGMAGMSIGHAVPGIVAILVFPPVDPEVWPWILLGVALHFGYQVFLLHAYRLGDLGQVYPIARGSAPLVVAIVSALALGATLSGGQIVAVVLIALGILAMGLARGGIHSAGALAAALVTGGFIAAYSLSDGVGARISGSPVAFFGWIAALGALPFGVYVRLTRPGLLRRLPRVAPAAFFFGGWMSFTAYGIVVWAFTRAPLALVTALRETSIVFALVIGVVFLGERVSVRRAAAAAVTLAGVVLMRLTG